MDKTLKSNIAEIEWILIAGIFVRHYNSIAPLVVIVAMLLLAEVLRNTN